jgi:hypothetical protein
MSFQPFTHFRTVGIVRQELLGFSQVFSTSVWKGGRRLVRGRLKKGDFTDARWDAVSAIRFKLIIKKINKVGY